MRSDELASQSAYNTTTVDHMSRLLDGGYVSVIDSSNSFSQWQNRVKGTNISTETLLATDYLNHYNEITMLIDLVPDMPEFLDECRKWEPKTYTDHFRDSDFSEKDLAIEAYRHAPILYKKQLEETISYMNSAVEWGLERLAEAIDMKEHDMLRMRAHSTGKTLRRLNEVASGIIHGTCKISGTMTAITQSDVDFKWRNTFVGAVTP